MADGLDVVTAQELRLAIGRVARRLRQLYATERDGAVSFIELGVLVRLQREGPTSPGTLAAGEGVTSQAIAGWSASWSAGRWWKERAAKLTAAAWLWPSRTLAASCS